MKLENRKKEHIFFLTLLFARSKCKSPYSCSFHIGIQIGIQISIQIALEFSDEENASAAGAGPPCRRPLL